MPANTSKTPSQTLPKDVVKSFSDKLLTWYDTARRDLPWRQTQDPYAILVSETMLQQTQVATVIPFYHRFLQQFPTVAALAQADLQQVLALWAGLGYYRRARLLHAAAQYVVAQYQGVFPMTAAALQELPGVGRYTAGAVASIAFGQRAPLVDGNVMRVLARLRACALPIDQAATQKLFWHWTEVLVPAQRPGDYNQALMELGATVCTPTQPACAHCPVRALCTGYAQGSAATLPTRRAAKANPELRWLACLLTDAKGRILMAQRPATGLWAGLWEPPLLALTKAPAKKLARPPAPLPATWRPLGQAPAFVHKLTHRTITVHPLRLAHPARAADYESLPWVTHYTHWRWCDETALTALPRSVLANKCLGR